MAALDITKISVAAFLKTANKGSAKRCLFGPVNHEENTRLLREQLASQEKESMEKWNFNFRTETPVRGGRFNWEKVNSSADQENTVPVAYALPRLSTPTKARVFSPLTFSAKVNRQQKSNSCSTEKKMDLSFSSDVTAKKDSVVAVVVPKPVSSDVQASTISPASERKPVTTVPVIKKFRDETPTVQELSAKCTKVSDQITPEASDSHVEDTSSSSSTCSTNSQLTTSPTATRSPSKRKFAQSDITEFFQIKKARNTMAVNSAKRRLDL